MIEPQWSLFGGLVIADVACCFLVGRDPWTQVAIRDGLLAIAWLVIGRLHP